jgi:hypothetical protein
VASKASPRHPGDGAAHPLKCEVRRARNTNTTRNEYRERRAALVRMRCIGANLTGSSKPRTSEKNAAPEGCTLAL